MNPKGNYDYQGSYSSVPLSQSMARSNSEAQERIKARMKASKGMDTKDEARKHALQNCMDNTSMKEMVEYNWRIQSDPNERFNFPTVQGQIDNCGGLMTPLERKLMDSTLAKQKTAPNTAKSNMKDLASTPTSTKK